MFRLNIPGCRVHYTGDYTETYKSIGTLYCFNVRVSGKRDLAFRITSKDSKYKQLYSIDVLGRNQEVIAGLKFKDQHDSPSDVAASRIIYHIITGKKQPIHESLAGALTNVSLILTILFSLVAVFYFLYYYKVQFTKWKEEKRANEIENSINRTLFKGQNGKEPEFDVYHGLIKSLDSVIKSKNINSLIVCGIPGTSKTHIVRRSLYFNNLQSGSDYIILKGSAMTMLDFVQALYNYRDKLVVLDDFDSPLEDPETVNILKSACDSYSNRIVSFPRAVQVSSAKEQGDYSIPQKFEFRGKIIIITNKKFGELDKALISRCLSTEVNFTVKEFLNAINKMLKYIMPNVDMSVKVEVYNYISDLASKGHASGLNFRTFQSAISLRLLYPENWEKMIQYVIK